MINNFRIPNIRLFVFGTLRVGGELDYYMEGSSPLGLYYTQGQLMESASGSAYINSEIKGIGTLGELHHVNYYCLQRINHLEITWAEFPKGYELALIPVWPFQDDQSLNDFNEDRKTMALCYKLRGASTVPGGDWMKRKSVIDEIGKLFETETQKTFYHNDVIQHIMNYLKT